MFGNRKNKISQAIREGNLEQLKILADKYPGTLLKTFSWQASGNALHMAAFFDQPEIVEYLVKEKGMSVNGLSNDDWTPLHHAAWAGAARSVEALLKLNANPRAKTVKGSTPYDVARNDETKLLLHVCLEKEQARIKQTARQYEAAARKEKTGGIKGTWTPTSSDEIIHTRELPDGQRSLTRIFNFAEESLTTIAENLKSGGISETTRFFDEIPGKKKILDEPRRRLAEIYGDAAAKEAAPQEPAVKRQMHNYAGVTGARV